MAVALVAASLAAATAGAPSKPVASAAAICRSATVTGQPGAPTMAATPHVC
jgi:hypothetical protein